MRGRDHRDRPPKPRRPRRWSLRRRLVASCVALVAAVCAVIGAVTVLALHDFLYGQLDSKVQDLAVRAGGGPHAPGQNAAGPGAAGPGILRRNAPDFPPAGGQGRPGAPAPLDFLVGGGQPGETVGAVLTASGSVGRAAVSATGSAGTGLVADNLTAVQAAAFAGVPLDGRPHTLHIPGLGAYRVESARPGADGTTTLVGLSTSGAHDTLTTLVWVEVSVTAAGLAAAGLAGAALMRIALQPLRRVAATATRVSELPLHSGEVAPLERVPDSDTDPRTEVGQVGAALNRMLGHVGSALRARQESETRVRRFVADASHELRTPLASIRGYAELTRRGGEPAGPDTRHALGRIESEAARMTTLVEDLLLLARLDAGRPLDLAETDVSPLVVDAVSDARATGHGHHWRLDLPDEPATVSADPQRLHQVLTNLLANARTHTPPGTTVTARVRRDGVREGGAVLLQVEDDGPGIPPELCRQVFERFARGDASRSRAAGSTGLGLAIVHSVVTAHGGEVAVDSAPGRTVFTVTLPGAPSQPVLSPATRS
ncbi:HAMP domain-containing sensor histidine kinase [Actinacidiphila sp. ITFR-21]|uniref:HAMP domain-containing sensor histidine kinase n=1 Tax=Actinacidiphila sp. ITFR-21 TaxID=3075199 RepID=UPI00288A0C2B|nr:HAMP domain-containing sensor histidine kinase [Streptomyces sp. ITFR-21]WNI16518.1 HAMP domain-containing sensor histidine kinase [Streptomyces sp. ITFR-21]